MKGKITNSIKNSIKNILPFIVIKSIQAKSGTYIKYNQDGLTTQHNCDFMNDELFLESYRLGKATGSWGACDIHWRAYIACWAAKKATYLEGDFVECGVYKGGLAMTVINYTRFQTLNKKFYLLDTFSGLSKECISEEEGKLGIGEKLYKYQECYETVKQAFKDFNNVEIIRGVVPCTLPLVSAKKVSYLSIDMNCAAPEIAAGKFFWDKLVPGSVIVLDDYGFASNINQKYAWDDFAIQKGIQVLSLPTGQGLIFKD